MFFKSIFQERRIWKKGKGIDQKSVLGHGNDHFTPGESSSSYASVQQSAWANLPPELLHDIINRVETNETSWPSRRAVVCCASVCKSWREITREVVRTPEECGLLTFPMSLKQSGPRDFPIQCFIRRDRATSTYRLYLGLTPALSGNTSKFLLAAKKMRKATKTNFVISFSPDDFSQTSDSYAGKLRSNFFGSKFSVHDCHPPIESPIKPHNLSHKKISTKKVSPRLPLCSYKVATVSYQLNVLRTRGPRRMNCTMHTFHNLPEASGSNPEESKRRNSDFAPPLVLRNKSPRWHEQLQCWCLNFRGRVTVASVKNFQLVADSCLDQEKVVLQFGKIGKDTFTMDYRYPLSAYQAFAICLSSFDTKPACE